jgi:molybdate transport system regulatory protein
MVFPEADVKTPVLKPRFRVMSGRAIALGPGKVQLLALVAETGSLRRAAAQLGMSYMRAWTLLRTMNRCFRCDLVVSSRGGRKGGGAELTPLGRKVLGLYLEMEAASTRACGPAWTKLRRCLAK